MISPQNAEQYMHFCRRVAATTTIHLFNRFQETRFKDGQSTDLKTMFGDDQRATEYSILVLKDAGFLKSCLENWVKALCFYLGADPIRSNTSMILKRFFKRLCVVYNCSEDKGSIFDHDRVLNTLEDCVYLRIKGILDTRAKKSARPGTSTTVGKVPRRHDKVLDNIPEDVHRPAPMVRILQRQEQKETSPATHESARKPPTPSQAPLPTAYKSARKPPTPSQVPLPTAYKSARKPPTPSQVPLPTTHKSARKPPPPSQASRPGFQKSLSRGAGAAKRTTQARDEEDGFVINLS